MIEKVNPSHPDKVADRIAGALVDLAYTKTSRPDIAVEVLLGHGKCHVINETNVHLKREEVKKIIHRIAGIKCKVDYKEYRQDEHLEKNQNEEIKCADNGIFIGNPLTAEEKKLAIIARNVYALAPTDGKYLLDNGKLILCQSNIKTSDLKSCFPDAIVNPIGDWTGGYNVDTGATNRKLGSDMGSSVSGGGLHGKDLSKADVSVNIYAFILAQKTGTSQKFSCAIGDSEINGKPYKEIVAIAREFIKNLGGFEKFAEWGLF